MAPTDCIPLKLNRNVLNKGVSAIETDNKSKSNLSILLAIRDTDLKDRVLEISYEYNSVVAVNCRKKSSNTWLIPDIFPGMIFESNRSKTLRLSSNEVASMYKFSVPDVNQLKLFEKSLPFGGKLNRDNRRISLAKVVPRLEFEGGYPQTFSTTGPVFVPVLFRETTSHSGTACYFRYRILCLKMLQVDSDYNLTKRFSAFT